MNIADLIFLYAAEEKSISKAASRAFVSQQCASKHIQNLESRYGVPLIQRRPHFALTEAGQALFATLQQIHLLESGVAEHIAELGGVCDRPFAEGGASTADLLKLDGMDFAVFDKEAAKQMKKAVSAARKAGDSLGGVLETAICGLPEGLGEPWFGGIEGEISRGIFGIPGVKGVEFGAGFALARMKGSEANDEFELDEHRRVVTKTNNCGGILGGISNGMPVIFRTAIKPTPSISKKQKTVDMSTMEETEIEINGRHDAAIAARAAVIIDSVTAICVCDLFTKRFGNDWATE